jgi:hypothetical protein
MSPADPELRRLYRDARQAAVALVARLEGYAGGLVPARENESELGHELAGFALDVERMFRGQYERSRDIREMLEDPDLRFPDDFPRPIDPDPRDGS